MAKILIVEDMPSIRRMLRSQLERSHQVVGELPDGYGAASKVEQTQPNIVVMDFNLPTVSGVHATRQIKSLYPHIVVVGYTSSDDEARERMLTAGADAVFAKQDVAGLIAFVNALAPLGHGPESS